MSDHPPWNLDHFGPARKAALASLVRESRLPRWDGIGSSQGMGTEPRQVLAGAWFSGGPGREQEAAEAWAAQLKGYFKRGIGEPPVATYEDGVYTVIGLIQTTHPNDRPKEDGIVWFS